MPFTPSSPIRLYTSRRSRTPLNVGDISASTKAQGPEIERTLESSSGADMEISVNSMASSFVNEARNQTSPLDQDKNSEDETSTSQSLQQKLMGLERPLSIQEVLTLNALNEDPLDQGPMLPKMIQRESILFENSSESEYNVEEDIAPIVGRASSVRVSRPQIVENRPTKMSKVQGQPVEHLRPKSQSSLRVERASDSQTSTLPTMAGESGHNDLGWTIRPVEAEILEEACSWTPAQEADTKSHSLTAPVKLNNYTYSKHDQTPYDPALPTGNTLRSLHASTDHPGSLSIASLSGPGITPIEARDNTAPKSAISPVKGLSRRVTIRPADLVTKNHHEHFAFRESVVTTPYPPRMSGEDNDYGSAERKSREIYDKKRTSYPYSPGRMDRFPSPERSERLFLVLRLQNRPSARVTIEIDVVDKSTFDDEALFKQIKVAYQQQLLTRSQKVFSLIRKISHVTVMGTSQLTDRHYPVFDSASFLAHLRSPKIGRRRKSWVLWLRNRNTELASNRTFRHMPPIRHIDNLTRLSTRARSSPYSQSPSEDNRGSHVETAITDMDGNQEKRLRTASDASSFLFSYSPAIPKLPFLATRHSNTGFEPHTPVKAGITRTTTIPSPHHSLFWPNLHSHSHSHSRAKTPTTTSLDNHQNPTTDTTTDTESQHSSLPTLTFHHTHRPTTLLLLTLLNILLAVLCATIWIIFGVPGTRPGGDHETQVQVGGGGEVTVGSDWRVNSQGRVGTGVIIGFVVFVVGLVGEGMLVWIGRVVL